MREFAALSVKTYSYFTYNNNEDKKTTQLENRIEQLEKNKLDVVSLSLLFSLEMSSMLIWTEKKSRNEINYLFYFKAYFYVLDTRGLSKH